MVVQFDLHDVAADPLRRPDSEAIALLTRGFKQ